MCGRYAFFAPQEAMVRAFGLEEAPELPQRYNIAPTQAVPAVRVAGDAQGSAGAGAARELVPLRWGLIPSWAKEPEVGNRMINARAETVAEKPSFRAALKRRRCVIPASGFYEWRKVPDGEGGGKQPWFIQHAEGEVLALAGLWESWTSKGGEETLETCTILTTAANAFMAPLHHRMPVILDGFALDAWLDHSLDPSGLGGLMQPAAAGLLKGHAVSKRVNSPRNEGPENIQPLEALAAP